MSARVVSRIGAEVTLGPQPARGGYGFSAGPEAGPEQLVRAVALRVRPYVETPDGARLFAADAVPLVALVQCPFDLLLDAAVVAALRS